MILSNIAKCLLLRNLRFVKHTCRRFQEKKSDKNTFQSLSDLSLEQIFQGKYTFLLPSLIAFSFELKSCESSR